MGRWSRAVRAGQRLKRNCQRFLPPPMTVTTTPRLTIVRMCSLTCSYNLHGSPVACSDAPSTSGAPLRVCRRSLHPCVSPSHVKRLILYTLEEVSLSLRVKDGRVRRDGNDDSLRVGLPRARTSPRSSRVCDAAHAVKRALSRSGAFPSPRTVSASLPLGSNVSTNGPALVIRLALFSSALSHRQHPASRVLTFFRCYLSLHQPSSLP